jgi:hypothetical protein
MEAERSTRADAARLARSLRLRGARVASGCRVGVTHVVAFEPGGGGGGGGGGGDRSDDATGDGETRWGGAMVVSPAWARARMAEGARVVP